MTYAKIIGIDTGTHTGIAVYDCQSRQLEICRTVMIHQAMALVDNYHRLLQQSVKVYVEDARQRKWFGSNAQLKQQGAGSVKRDCAIWEDFLTDNGIEFQMVAPAKGKTKLSESYFRAVTGYNLRTSEHARDAGMLCFGKNY